MASLVDNSLLVQRASDDAEPRFIMLETFREYGRERLLDSGETAATGRAHAAYMLVLAEEGTLEMNPSERDGWLRCCDAEHDNFRGAIHYLITTGNAEWALRLAGALFRFWEQRDHLTEGRETLARVLAMPGAEGPTRARARALYGATVLADIQDELSTAEKLSHEACAIYRQFDDPGGIAATMTAMAWQAQRQGRHAEATRLFWETVSLWQQLGDGPAVDMARSNMANAAKAEGNFDLARSLLNQVAEAFEARGDVRGVASALNGLGDVMAAQGDHDAAAATIIKASSVTGRSTIAGELRGCCPIWPASICRRATMPRRTARSDRPSMPFARWDTSAAWRASSSRCPGAPAARRATKRRSCWRVPRRPSGRRLGRRPSRSSGRRSSARSRRANAHR